MNPDVFIELSLIFGVAVVVTGITRLLKQPSIIGYILSGIIAGPLVLNLIDSTTTFSAFSQIGVALLLFFVGLNLNPKVIKDVGKVAVITGLSQVIITTSIGYVVSRFLLGFSTTASLFVGIALAFSSTIIIMKLLSDKRDIESLYGRISVGFLIVQDLVAILVLLAISSMGRDTSLASLAVETLLKGVGGMLILFLLSRYILPRLTSFIAKSQEFLLLFSLAWCFVVASAFHYINFSLEAGALLAGIALSTSPYHFEISSKMKPLRDFFLVLFFIMLGSQMVFTNILSNIWIILGLSALVIIGNPIIVMTIMGFLNYTKRNSFLAGLTVAQISEFSLIVLSLGVSSGQISQEILTLLTAVGLVTFASSSYIILYADSIYSSLSKYLSIFERSGKKVDEHKYHQHDDHDIILFGYNRIGFDILESLKRIKKKFLIIDYNPDTIVQLSREGYDCKYGDANNSELLNELNLKKVKMVISTIPEVDTNLLIIKKVRSENENVIISVVSHHIEEAESLYEQGATYVIMPHFLGGRHFSTMIENKELSMNSFLEEKIKHLEHLNRRRKMGHSHPRHEHK
ncbi:MAG: cation:proton antiporter [Candidatus Woesearchaeota archaeon]